MCCDKGQMPRSGEGATINPVGRRAFTNNHVASQREIQLNSIGLPCQRNVCSAGTGCAIAALAAEMAAGPAGTGKPMKGVEQRWGRQNRAGKAQTRPRRGWCQDLALSSGS